MGAALFDGRSMMVDESVRQAGSGLAVSVFARAEASEEDAPLVI